MVPEIRHSRLFFSGDKVDSKTWVCANLVKILTKKILANCFIHIIHHFVIYYHHIRSSNQFNEKIY